MNPELWKRWIICQFRCQRFPCTKFESFRQVKEDSAPFSYSILINADDPINRNPSFFDDAPSKIPAFQWSGSATNSTRKHQHENKSDAAWRLSLPSLLYFFLGMSRGDRDCLAVQARGERRGEESRLVTGMEGTYQSNSSEREPIRQAR